MNDLQQKLKQTEDRLSTQERLTQQERDARSSELNTTKAKLNQATEQLTARDSENKALTAALTEAGRNLEQKQRAEQDRQALARRLIDVEDELNQFRLDGQQGKTQTSGSSGGKHSFDQPGGQSFDRQFGNRFWSRRQFQVNGGEKWREVDAVARGIGRAE